MSTTRLESFSDGVLAVAITLLSLDLAVRGPGHGTLASQLGHHWPAFASYAVSFVLIGIIWINHHALFSNLERIDRGVLFANLVFLMFVVCIPFATSTMASYLRLGGSDAHLAAAIYAATLEGMGISFTVVFLWSVRHGLFRAEFDNRSNQRATLRFGLGAVAYACAIGLAFVSPMVTLIVVALVAVYYIFDQVTVSDSIESTHEGVVREIE